MPYLISSRADAPNAFPGPTTLEIRRSTAAQLPSAAGSDLLAAVRAVLALQVLLAAQAHAGASR